MFGKKAPAGPPDEDEVRERIEQAIDEGAAFIAIRKGLVNAGSDVKMVDRVIAEVLHERSGADASAPDPFLKHGASITHSHTRSEEEHADHTEHHEHMADRIAEKHIAPPPSKLVSNTIFLLTFLLAIGGSAYAFLHFMPERDRACEDGGMTSLICVELLLNRYYEAHAEYPARLDLLVPRYAVVPVRFEETGEPFFYTTLTEGSGYRLCPGEESGDDECSIRNIRKLDTHSEHDDINTEE